MENKNLFKTIAATGALLFGVAYADETTASASDFGIYSVEVEEVKKVWLSNNENATKINATEILQNIGPNTAESPLVLEFTVLTNLEEWNLELTTANGGRLLREDGTPLRTDAENHDGSTGSNGSLYVLLKEITEGEIDNVNVIPFGNDVDVSNGKINRLSVDAFDGITEFQSQGLVKAVFEVKAGLGGEKIIAPPGTYTETVTVTLIGNTP